MIVLIQGGIQKGRQAHGRLGELGPDRLSAGVQINPI
jgi:hypothetical protein